MSKYYIGKIYTAKSENGRRHIISKVNTVTWDMDFLEYVNRLEKPAIEHLNERRV